MCGVNYMHVCVHACVYGCICACVYVWYEYIHVCGVNACVFVHAYGVNYMHVCGMSACVCAYMHMCVYVV